MCLTKQGMVILQEYKTYCVRVLHVHVLIANACTVTFSYKWVLTRQNLSLGFPTKRDANLCPQLQRLAGKYEFLVANLFTILYEGRISKTLISYRGCAGWYEPLLFETLITG